jgi:Xaa-Pro aminopeptidase
MLHFQQLTLCPIDLRPTFPEQLSQDEKDWLNEYHATVRAELSPYLSGQVLAWLRARTAPVS